MRIGIGLGRLQLRQALVVGAVVIGSTVVGGVAQAAGVMHIPGVDGIIHACYNEDNGRLRVIDPLARRCTEDEQVLQWNQTGPQGPAGAPGISGYQQVIETINNFNLAASTESVHVVKCPAGKTVLSGGFILFGTNGFLSNNTNGPVDSTQWAVSIYNPSSANTVSVNTVTFYAVCAVVS